MTHFFEKIKLLSNSSLVKKILLFGRNKTFNILFRIAITALFFFFVNKSISRHDLQKLTQEIKPNLLAIVMMSSFLCLYFQILRWKYILQSKNFSCNFMLALKTLLWGNFLGFLTPGRLGELFRGVNLNNGRKVDSIQATIIDRLFAIIIVVFTGILCIMIQTFYSGILAPEGELLSLSILIGIICIGLMLIKMEPFKNIQLIKKCSVFIDECRLLVNFKIVAVSVLAHGFLIIQTLMLLRMFGSAGWIDNCLIAGQTYFLMLFLPFFIANVGLREYSFGLFLKQFSQGQESEIIAFGVSNLILIINIIFPALIGLIWVVVDRNTSNNLFSYKSDGNSNMSKDLSKQESRNEVSTR